MSSPNGFSQDHRNVDHLQRERKIKSVIMSRAKNNKKYTICKTTKSDLDIPEVKTRLYYCLNVWVLFLFNTFIQQSFTSLGFNSVFEIHIKQLMHNHIIMDIT